MTSILEELAENQFARDSIGNFMIDEFKKLRNKKNRTFLETRNLYYIRKFLKKSGIKSIGKLQV